VLQQHFYLDDFRFYLSSTLETVETALRLNFTSGEGLDVSPRFGDDFRFYLSSTLETVETAVPLNFTSGEGLDVSPRFWADFRYFLSANWKRKFL
jgi:hypothetical protein